MLWRVEVLVYVQGAYTILYKKIQRSAKFRIQVKKLFLLFLMDYMKKMTSDKKRILKWASGNLRIAIKF